MRGILLGALLVLLFAPAADARPAPALYFLHDAEAPVLPGILNVTAPTGPDPSVRPVTLGTEELPSAVFVTELEEHAGRLKGRLLLGLWMGQSAVFEGNLTAILYEVDADGARTPLVRASLDIARDPTQTDPTTLVPPDPTNVTESVAYLQYQALTALLPPPVLVDLGLVDVNVTGPQLALGLFLEPAPGGVAPAGAASIQYDGQFHPSFAFVPWYEPDPPKAAPSPTTKAPAPSTPTSVPTTSSSPPARESAGVGACLVGVALVAYAVLRRRP